MKRDDLDEGTQIKINSLNEQQHRVVIGIDLTGSAKRPSGFCVLQNAHAITYRVRGFRPFVRKTSYSKSKIRFEGSNPIL